MRNLFVLVLVAGAIVFQGSSRALAQGSWVGEEVVHVKPAKEIKFGDVVQGKEIYFSFSERARLKVLDEREGWLRINDGYHLGWVDKADFILVRDAPAYFHRRVQANPKDTWALYMRGRAWIQKGELDNAIKDFDEIIRLKPTDAFAFVMRGIAWSYKKELDKAMRDFDEGIRLNPTDPAAFDRRGQVWADKKEYDKAIKDCDEAIRLNPTDPVAFDRRGLVWAGKKEYDKAIKDCDEAIRLSPKDPNPVYNKACYFALQGRADPAIENLRKSIELGYDNFDHMAKDSDLDSIRDDTRYKELLKKYSK